MQKRFEYCPRSAKVNKSPWFARVFGLESIYERE